jgi:hypothetical protein
VIENVLVGVHHVFDSVASSERLGACPVARSDRDQAGPGQRGGLHDRQLADPGRTENPDPQQRFAALVTHSGETVDEAVALNRLRT